MFTWFLIFSLPGAFVFGGLAWLWRYRLNHARSNIFIALVMSLIAWASSMVFGWFLYLDVLEAEALGPALSAGVIWSLLPGYFGYFILRKKIESPIPVNTMEYFKK